MLQRLGYDPRALVWQTIAGEIVLVLSYLLTPSSKNVNWVFGLGAQPQRRLPPLTYLAVVMAAYPLLIYGPLHLVFEAPTSLRLR